MMFVQRGEWVVIQSELSALYFLRTAWQKIPGFQSSDPLLSLGMTNTKNMVAAID
jgi:hypothetical protein